MGEPVRPLDVTEVGSFDVETDVLVTGFGAAGSCAAHAARERGVDVLVAERASGPGGAAALSEGIVYLGGGTPVQTSCGFEDSVDNMVRYLLAACGPEPDEAKVAAYAEARQASDKALELGTPEPAFYYHAGMIAAAMGDPAAARKHLEHALSLNPNFDPKQAALAHARMESSAHIGKIVLTL